MCISGVSNLFVRKAKWTVFREITREIKYLSLPPAPAGLARPMWACQCRQSMLTAAHTRSKWKIKWINREGWTSSATTWEKREWTSRKLTEILRYFKPLSAQSLTWNDVCLAMTAVAEIVVKGYSACSFWIVDHWQIWQICYKGSCPLNFNKISKSSQVK